MRALNPDHLSPGTSCDNRQAELPSGEGSGVYSLKGRQLPSHRP